MTCLPTLLRKVWAGILSLMTYYLRRSKTYFLWFSNNSLLNVVISIPRKYFSIPRSLIANFHWSECLRLKISSALSPVMMRPSTQRSTTSLLTIHVRTNMDESTLLILKLDSLRTKLSLVYQALGDCFSP